jgi:hypothetical protein
MGEALADQVRAIVTAVIAAEEFDGKAELLAQVPRLRVVGGPITFLNLAVSDPSVPRSVLDHGPVPGQSWVHDEEGAAIGGLLVWVDEGLISALEYFWTTDEPPSTLPSTDQVTHQRV